MGDSYAHTRGGKFTFHTAMLRDKLGELSMGRDVEIVKKACASQKTSMCPFTNPTDSSSPLWILQPLEKLAVR
jgi:hypothetical protein